MTNQEVPPIDQGAASSLLLFDRLLACRERHGILGAARALNATERNRLDEARQAIQCLGLPSHVVPVPIVDKTSLEILLANTLKNPFGATLDTTSYLDRYAYYFFFAPLRVESSNFKEAQFNLRSDFEHDSETQEPPCFFELFPRTEIEDVAKLEQSLEIGINGQMKVSATTPEFLYLAEGTRIAGTTETSAALKAKLTQGVTKVWKNVLIRTSVPPDVVATWSFRSRDSLSQDKPVIAFILQIPKGLKKTRISYEIKVRFNSPPWERVIAKWVEALRELWSDLSPDEKRDICLLESYVRDGLWSAYYEEQPMIRASALG
ncbi:hypothetical protein [Candidatus Accumulibacter sp. ACC007]|uniref:hypothetical protein n=1 Tax=Candidatus Accumulibacter sp. ACC007 TaxID=2823333 RepID=UPI0025BB883D|nr:hypothetical protein [Candidatus Accumulibacter sp. ACC007]